MYRSMKFAGYSHKLILIAMRLISVRKVFFVLQLVHEYNTGIARNDQSLFHYGFVREHDPPRLVAQDMPAGNLYDPTFYTEDDYGKFSSS